MRKKNKENKWKALPNEQHRAEKWAGGRVHENKKSYRRNSKREQNIKHSLHDH